MRRRPVVLLALGLMASGGCEEQPSARQPAAWYSGGTLTNATLDRWQQADDHNRLATSLDLITSRLIRQGIAANTLDVEALKPASTELRDCITEAASREPSSARVNDVATDCLEHIDVPVPAQP